MKSVTHSSIRALKSWNNTFFFKESLIDAPLV